MLRVEDAWEGLQRPKAVDNCFLELTERKQLPVRGLFRANRAQQPLRRGPSEGCSEARQEGEIALHPADRVTYILRNKAACRLVHQILFDGFGDGAFIIACDEGIGLLEHCLA